MSDMERMELALRKVASHKIKGCNLSPNEWKLLAETAVKTMWLIDDEANDKRPGVEK